MMDGEQILLDAIEQLDLSPRARDGLAAADPGTVLWLANFDEQGIEDYFAELAVEEAGMIFEQGDYGYNSLDRDGDETDGFTVWRWNSGWCYVASYESEDEARAAVLSRSAC